ncbi:MAG: hypothetical protein JWP81_548 [Ferruginibacter sp.]|nr:hypothetical protein [Ferruginibacter sp.]
MPPGILIITGVLLNLCNNVNKRKWFYNHLYRLHLLNICKTIS